MPTETVETVIVGGGQAGLAMSYYLGQRGLEHVILERRRIAERWRSERWELALLSGTELECAASRLRPSGGRSGCLRAA